MTKQILIQKREIEFVAKKPFNPNLVEQFDAVFIFKPRSVCVLVWTCEPSP